MVEFENSNKVGVGDCWSFRVGNPSSLMEVVPQKPHLGEQPLHLQLQVEVLLLQLLDPFILLGLQGGDLLLQGVDLLLLLLDLAKATSHIADVVSSTVCK